MTYSASLDKLAKVITMTILVLFTLGMAAVYLSLQPHFTWIHLFGAIIMIAGVVLTFLMRPVSYTVTADQLIIHRAISDISIERNNIKMVQRLNRDQIRGSIRLFGVGGLFGYFGYFSNSRLGRMRWFVTRRDNPVLILTRDDKKIIVTPDLPADFVARLAR